MLERLKRIRGPGILILALMCAVLLGWGITAMVPADRSPTIAVWHPGGGPLGLTQENVEMRPATMALTAEIVACDTTPAATSTRRAANNSQFLNSAIYGTDAGPSFVRYNSRLASKLLYTYRPSWPMTRDAVNMTSHPLRA